MRHTTPLAGLAIAGALTLAACGRGSDTPTVTPAAQTPTTTAPSTSTSTTATPATSTSLTPTTAAPAAITTTVGTVKVAANTASQAEIQKALEANGVANAANWAREVVEYRPYPTNDPTFAKLRQNLVKYNPGPGVVDQIVASLSLQ